MTLLDVSHLDIAIATRDGLLPVVDDLCLQIGGNETLGLVGESGCGKSLTALAIMGLLDDSSVRITGGHIHFNGEDLLALPAARRRALMGSRLAMIFQEPMTSLNPVYRVGEQIVEMLRQHTRLTHTAARQRAVELLEQVKIPEPRRRIDQYPHQLSGGQRQRVMIAMAMACGPQLLIADEPTTALDVTVQQDVLALMRELQRDTGTAILLISHDLGVIAETCHRVAVMYRGRIVDAADTDALFRRQAHPYTRGLLQSLPPVDRDVEWLDAIPGRVPSLDEPIAACAFHPRCPYVDPRCTTQSPPPVTVADGHVTRCHFAGHYRR